MHKCLIFVNVHNVLLRLIVTKSDDIKNKKD